MILAALIRGARSEERDPGGVATATPATPATLGEAKERTVAKVATVAVAKPPAKGIDALPDPRAEARRKRVLAMLADRQSVRYAVLTDTEAEPDAVILALAIRGAMPDGGTVTCELRIPREKYDGFLLLDLIARYGGTLH